MHKHGSRDSISFARRYSVPRSSTTKAVESFLSGIDSPRSLAVWLLYKYQEHEQLVALEIDPSNYQEIGKFRDDYLATSFLSKADFLSLPFNRKEVALGKFTECESKCRQTNARFRNLSLDPQFKGPNVWLLNAVTRKIERILGEFDPNEWFELCSWGPGSTFHLGGADTSTVNKFQIESGITPELYHLVADLIPVAYPLWGELLSERDERGEDRYLITPGNKITTVAKNAKTDRVIAIEPGLNVWFQLGIGKMISRRLLRSEGIDLASQDRNGLLAFYGSLTSKLATVDFSSASDLISSEVVRTILPSAWHSVLDSCRSMSSRIGQKWLKLEKFSSMGNGFTFPLQSLIFTACALSVCNYLGVPDEYVGVFGDDVVIPSDAYPLFVEFCEFLGFSVNAQKSFSTGYFRESCGTHYFHGLDVKPLYLKKRLSNVDTLYRLANSVRRLAHRIGFGRYCDARFRTCWLFLRNSVPAKLRIWICEGFGDGGLIANFDEASPSRLKAAKRQLEGFFVTSLVQIGVSRQSCELGLLLSKLRYPSERETVTYQLPSSSVTLSVNEEFDIAVGLPTRNSYSLRATTRYRFVRYLVPRDRKSVV